MKRFLAMLCAICLCCTWVGGALPTLAEDEAKIQATQSAKTNDESDDKKAEKEAKKKEKEEKKKAEEEAKKKEEEEAKKKAEEEKKKAEEEAKKKAEEEAKKKAEEEAKKKEEEEAKKKAEEEAKKKEEEEAKKKAEEEAKKKEEEEKKKAEEEAKKKEEEEKKKAEEEAKKKEEEEKKKAEEEAKQKEEEEKEKPTAAPTEAPTAAPTEAPTAAPTAAPTEAPTAAPTEAPTAAPTAEPTPAPTAEPTAAPTEAPTEAPTAEPTEAPTEAPTVEPTEEPTPEPTPTPAPLKLSGLKASSDEVAPGKTVKFTLTVENAEKVVWSAKRSDGLNGGSGSVEGGGFSWKPTATGVYTVTVNASAGDMTASESCTVIVRAAKLSVTAKAATNYAMQGGEDLRYNVSVKGGCEPYTVSITIDFKGKQIYRSKELETEVTCGAVGYGENKLTVTVTDAAGDTEKADATILSASNAKNDAPSLPKLSADMTFAERLVAVANSQLGYRESEENFIIRSDHSVQGWSYYGGWYGMPYEEWCAMFVSYCLEKAGIDKGVMPRSANCNRWKNYLGVNYIDEEDEYFPSAGDLIFFHHDRVSKDPNFPNHIGIVTGYDPEKAIVYTVEGNSGKSVRTHQYNHSDSVIVGYASMRECMLKWDKVYKARLGEQVTADLNAGLAKVGEELKLADLLPALPQL